jgi:hypothetical protein
LLTGTARGLLGRLVPKSNVEGSLPISSARHTEMRSPEAEPFSGIIAFVAANIDEQFRGVWREIPQLPKEQ